MIELQRVLDLLERGRKENYITESITQILQKGN